MRGILRLTAYGLSPTRSFRAILQCLASGIMVNMKAENFKLANPNIGRYLFHHQSRRNLEV